MPEYDPFQFDVLWDYNDPAGTEARFRELLPMPEDQPSATAELLTQIARAQGLQRRFADAHLTLDDVEQLLPDLEARPGVRYWLERGRVYNSSGDKETARVCFETALRLASSDAATEQYAVDAAHMLAIVAPPDEALDWNLRALAMAEAATDPAARDWRGSLYNNIGWTYHAQGDYPTALAYLQKALDFRREKGQAAETFIARWCVARVRRDLGEVEQALAEQQALREEMVKLDRPDGYVYEEIAECLLLLGEVNAARPYFALAYDTLSQDAWLTAEEPERLARLYRLSGAGA